MITLILKTTDGCNLRCRYCSIGEKNSRFSTMSLETMKLAGDYVIKKLRIQNDKSLRIIFHGGEPTLISPVVYRNFIDYMYAQCEGISLSFSIQTNAYQITDDFMELIEKYKISVGVSIDGSKNVHDSMRLSVSGHGTYDKVTENMVRMKRAGINVSALVVVSSELMKEDLSYINFFNYHCINLKLNPLLKMGEAEKNEYTVPEAGSYAEYIILVYKYMLENEIEIDIRPISDIFNAIVNDRNMYECSYRDVCGKNIISIDYNGDIYPCGRFGNVAESCMGNIKNEKLNFNVPCLVKQEEECRKCRWIKWCNGGCDAYSYLSGTKQTPLCLDNRILFEFFSGDGIDEYIKYLKKRRGYLEERLGVGGSKNV
ncbi:MAG: radical SAM protein [Clostridia bacterium]|nr:radical SAM protein [Clostridia bacterium]